MTIQAVELAELHSHTLTIRNGKVRDFMVTGPARTTIDITDDAFLFTTEYLDEPIGTPRKAGVYETYVLNGNEGQPIGKIRIHIQTVRSASDPALQNVTLISYFCENEVGFDVFIAPELKVVESGVFGPTEVDDIQTFSPEGSKGPWQHF